MAGAKKLKSQLDKKQKDAAEKLRYGNRTEKQKKFLVFFQQLHHHTDML